MQDPLQPHHHRRRRYRHRHRQSLRHLHRDRHRHRNRHRRRRLRLRRRHRHRYCNYYYVNVKKLSSQQDLRSIIGKCILRRKIKSRASIWPYIRVPIVVNRRAH